MAHLELDSVAAQKAAACMLSFEPFRKIKVDWRCNQRGSRPIGFLAPYGFTSPLASHMSTPWSVFQGGRMETAGGAGRAVRTPRQRANRDRGSVSAGMTTAGLGATAIRIGQRPSRSADRLSRSTSGRAPRPHSLPDNFKHSLTLFSKSFSSFPRGTCLLSVSPVFSLGPNLPPDWGCIPKQPDFATAPAWCGEGRTRRGSHLRAPLSEGLGRSARGAS
ncbi:hypothetical protein FNV43_RR20893 [Rhamnella rubrinervis]|uniref:Protein TAR1 n=1 Tax=Rhamnella rubrinervis TaxID=2594499 RepID=A0A8K0DV85_9ROSA|nr:hypothetical protein FNV43_RR20893 [Rhamnella rubrinervis]